MFNSWNLSHLQKFNSYVSQEFLEGYEDYRDSMLKKDAARMPHRTFAASSFRCDRLSWFRLRGVEPDVPDHPDSTLDFIAGVGTACHRMLQTNMKAWLGADWIDVSDHLKDVGVNYKYTLTQDNSGLEYLVEVDYPPIRFACDGIIRWKGHKYLLEIKTSEFDSWDKLVEPKQEHVDQAKLYSSLLKLDGILFIYQDRLYGGIKCFEVIVTEADYKFVNSKIEKVLQCVEYNIAPDPLPRGDKWCSPSYCSYYKRCKDW